MLLQFFYCRFLEFFPPGWLFVVTSSLIRVIHATGNALVNFCFSVAVPAKYRRIPLEPFLLSVFCTAIESVTKKAKHEVWRIG